MPLPRPSGSGAWKILVLPHRLEYEVFDLITLSSHPAEPCVGSFEGGLFCRGLLRGPNFDLSFLWAIATNVSQLIAVVTRHLSQPSFAHFLLSPVIPFSRLEGWLGCIVHAQPPIFLATSSFYFPLVVVVVEDVLSIG